MLPERYLLFLLEYNGIDPSEQGGTISNEKIRSFSKSCKQFLIKVNGTLPLEKAFVTGGGVSVKGNRTANDGLKINEWLYFCGEILDVHGYTGGYNITSALVTGRLAGTNAALSAKKSTKTRSDYSSGPINYHR